MIPPTSAAQLRPTRVRLPSPLAPWLARPDVTDIWINRAGEVWTETLGGGIERHEEPALSEKLLARLARDHRDPMAAWHLAWLRIGQGDTDGVAGTELEPVGDLPGAHAG